MTGEKFIEALDGVRKGSQSWMALCPSHNDTSPSLSISAGTDGRILVHCFAGCSIQEICDALGLQVRDLFPTQSANPRVIRDARRKRELDRDKRRRKSAYQGVRIDLLRESEGLIQAARGIDISAWDPERLNQELNRLAAAYMRLEVEANV